MTDATFKSVGGSDEKMYGEKKILVCGFSLGEHLFFLDLLSKNNFENLPVVFVMTEQKEETLEQLFGKSHKSGLNEPSHMPRAIIMSGFTENELNKFVNLYRDTKLPHQLWATLTPTSETWKIGNLLIELIQEREAIRQMKQSKQQAKN